MNISKLESDLDLVIGNYVDEIKLRYSENYEPATRHDIFEAGMQTAYLLDQFRETIVKSLK